MGACVWGGAGAPKVRVFEYTRGGAFGELALLHGEARLATVRAAEDCACWALDRDTFRKIMMSTGRQDMGARTRFLGRVPLLQGLAHFERFKIAEVRPPPIPPPVRAAFPPTGGLSPPGRPAGSGVAGGSCGAGLDGARGLLPCGTREAAARAPSLRRGTRAAGACAVRLQCAQRAPAAFGPVQRCDIAS
jgi:hypothetical protein